MSFHAMRMVIEHANVKTPTQFLLLLIVADQAEDDGVMKFPRTNAWLAKRARIADGSTVARTLNQLQECGQLRTVNANGNGGGCRHRLVLPGLKLRNSSGTAKVDAAQGDLLTASQAGSQPDEAGSQPDDGGSRSSLCSSLSFPIDPRGADAPEPEVDSSAVTGSSTAKDLARQLAIVAMEQPVKPVIRNARNPFVAVMKLFESLLIAGTQPTDIGRAVLAGVDVWTLAGVQTAIARSRPRNGRHDGTSAVMDELRQGR